MLDFLIIFFVILSGIALAYICNTIIEIGRNIRELNAAIKEIEEEYKKEG